MDNFVDVIVPGPWWSPLTYRSDRRISEATRVIVPVGRSKRTGFVVSNLESIQDREISKENIREILSPIDEEVLVPLDLWKLSEWAGRNFLCGRGEILKVIFPTPLIRGEEIAPTPEAERQVLPGHSTRTCFIPEDKRRYENYISEMEASRTGGMVIFPEYSQARNFFESLPQEVKEKWKLWPKGGQKKNWEAWLEARSGTVRGIVGSLSASFAPLPGMDLVIIEDESNWAYRQIQYPYLNIRSLLAQRAKLLHARLIVGGRVPSSRVFSTLKPSSEGNTPRKRLFMVDMHDMPQPRISGVELPFRISQRMLQETDKTLKDGKVALWILDRKGYAGDIFCGDCGFSLNCPKCGNIMSWREISKELICSLCGENMPLPRSCPNCGGTLLKGKRPGLEALSELAVNLLNTDLPVIGWHADDPRGEKARRERIGKISAGGLVTGSRNALVLCDQLSIGTICWIDADLEALSSGFESNFKAYSMIWESCFRGLLPEERTVVLQSRYPGKKWQKGLIAGWDFFWQDELKERKEFELPPYCYLIEFFMKEPLKSEVEASLEKKGYEVMDPGVPGSSLWIKVRDLKALKRDLEPFYGISRSRKGFPELRLWMD